MIIKKRKGVSTIVATVLTILITVAAVVLLIGFLKPFVEDSLKKSSECLPYSDYYTFENSFFNDSKRYEFNCYQKTENQILISSMIKSGTNLSQKDSENLKGFVIVFSDSDSSQKIELYNGKSIDKNLGGVWKFQDNTGTLKINGPNDIVTYVYNSSKIYNKAELYPLLNSGRICEKMKDEIIIKGCNGVTLQ